jgi:predicted nucleic acid-binding protein
MAIARSCRKAGITVPNTDLLISACVKEHGAGLEHSDADFDRIFEVLESG